MDLFRKLASSLEPLGGALRLDQFMEARRAAAAAQQADQQRARQAAQKVARAAQGSAAGEARAPGRPARPAPAPPAARGVKPDELTDTGRLRLEVEAFMSRDDAEGTDDSEVQEFMKERRGFDPTEIE